MSNNLPVRLTLPPEQLTEPVLKSYFSKEVSRKEYQQVLQNLEKIKPTKENLTECNAIVKGIEGVVKELNDYATDAGKAYFNAHRAILKAMKELTEPISTKVTAIKADIKAKNDELLAEFAKAEAEKQRIAAIQAQMQTFINNCTQFITTATTDKQISTIQARIGTEKSRTTFYAEFMPEFKDKCAALNDTINARKEYLRKEAELSAAAAKALLSGDAETAAEIKDKQEQLADEMEENILRLQEKAFDQITNTVQVVVAEPVGETIYGRNYWRWEIIDSAKLYKKHPEMVILEPNKEAIDKYMAENREQWKANKLQQVEYDGINFFIKKYL